MNRHEIAFYVGGTGFLLSVGSLVVRLAAGGDFTGAAVFAAIALVLAVGAPRKDARERARARVRERTIARERAAARAVAIARARAAARTRERAARRLEAASGDHHSGENSMCRREGLDWRCAWWTQRRGVVADHVGRTRAHGLLDHAVDRLLDRAACAIPDSHREQLVEVWADHRSHYHGWRLLWWALCARATAGRTARELRTAQLPRTDW